MHMMVCAQGRGVTAPQLPQTGLEPVQPESREILSLLRLPFRHCGLLRAPILSQNAPRRKGKIMSITQDSVSSELSFFV